LSLLSIIGGLLKLFNGLLSFFRDNQLREDGAARQRDIDLRAENEAVSKAIIAGNNVTYGGGVPIETDKFNRDNQ
jgi:hypothetical protein